MDKDRWVPVTFGDRITKLGLQMEKIIGVVFIVLFVFGFTDLEGQSTNNQDTLYFLGKKDKNPRYKRYSKFQYTQLDELSLLAECSKLCEEKYKKKHGKQFRKLRLHLEKARKIQFQEIDRAENQYLAKINKIRNRDPNRPSGRILPMEESEEGKKFTKKLLEKNAKTVASGTTFLSEEAQELLTKEKARFVFMAVGISGVFDEPSIKKAVGISDSKRKELKLQWEQALKDYFKKEIGEFDKDRFFDGILAILNERQVAKLEKRLGFLRQHIKKMFPIHSARSLERLLNFDREYELSPLSRPTKIYNGFEGLKKIETKLPKETIVRFHIAEADILTDRFQFDFNCQSVVQRDSPINELNLSQVQQPIERDQSSPFWGHDPSPDQLNEMKTVIVEWKKDRANERSVQQRVIANNELLEKLSNIVKGPQGFGVFRGFFYDHGPILFFFLPSVKRDFKLKNKQLDRLRSLATRELNSIDRFKRLYYKWELEFANSILDKHEIGRLEKLTGMSLERILKDRCNYYQKINRHPSAYNYSPFQIDLAPLFKKL